MILTAADAFRKRLHEGVEQLDELSTGKLEKYEGKARMQLQALASKRGRKSAADLKTVDKRNAGMQKSGQIRSKRYADDHDIVSKKSYAAFKEAAHKVLTDNGYELTHPGKASNLYTKHEPETNSLHIAKHHIGHPATQDSHHYHEGEIKLVSSNGTTSNVRNQGAFGTKILFRKEPDIDLVAHHSKEINDTLDSHHRWSDNSTFNSHMNEDVEIEPETETIEEGRGRPRKDGTSAVGADREHIMMQLRKHVSLNGANPIEFKDGSKHKITSGEARLAQIVHSGLKTSIEKGNFEKKLDRSHASFKEALAKKDEAGKGTAKPGITLPALQRINRLKFASGE